MQLITINNNKLFPNFRIYKKRNTRKETLSFCISVTICCFSNNGTAQIENTGLRRRWRTLQNKELATPYSYKNIIKKKWT
jgi:hypothetical protein